MLVYILQFNKIRYQKDALHQLHTIFHNPKCNERGDSMALSTISARIDSKDKSDFDRFCNNVGLSTSTAINLFVKAVLRENRIPFEITGTSDLFYSESNQDYILKSVNELRNGKGHAHELIEDDVDE